MPAYRISRFNIDPKKGLITEYSDANATCAWHKGHNGLSALWGSEGTWSKKGKIFFSKTALRAYLDRFINIDGQLNFSLVRDWEIEEIGVGKKRPEEFYHMWEHLRNQIWEKQE